MQKKQSHSGTSRGRGELALLAEIRQQAERAAGVGPKSGLRVGIGDDCALLTPRKGEEVAITTDLSIAGRRYHLDWHTPEAIGHRTLARGLSDLAAMGSRPVAAFLSLGLPRSLTVVASGHRTGHRSWVQRFLDGFLSLAEAHNTPLAGGDLAESPVAVADIVLVGAVPRGRALLRSGAKPATCSTLPAHSAEPLPALLAWLSWPRQLASIRLASLKSWNRCSPRTSIRSRALPRAFGCNAMAWSPPRWT